MTTTEEFLSHHGIKGMKWGRRKQKTPIRTSADHRKLQALKANRTSQLTNNQLKSANERLNLEANFRRMNPKAQLGHEKVKKYLALAGVSSVSIPALLKSDLGKNAVALGKHFLTRRSRANVSATKDMLARIAKSQFG